MIFESIESVFSLCVFFSISVFSLYDNIVFSTKDEQLHQPVHKRFMKHSVCSTFQKDLFSICPCNCFCTVNIIILVKHERICKENTQEWWKANIFSFDVV